LSLCSNRTCSLLPGARRAQVPDRRKPGRSSNRSATAPAADSLGKYSMERRTVWDRRSAWGDERHLQMNSPLVFSSQTQTDCAGKAVLHEAMLLAAPGKARRASALPKGPASSFLISRFFPKMMLRAHHFVGYSGPRKYSANSLAPASRRASCRAKAQSWPWSRASASCTTVEGQYAGLGILSTCLTLYAYRRVQAADGAHKFRPDLAKSS